MPDSRKVLESMPPLHLYCAREEDWDNLFKGLLHDQKQRFMPSDPLPENHADGYRHPMILCIGGQRLYVYPPREINAK